MRERVERLLALSQSAGDFFSDCAPALEAASADADQVLSAAEAALEPELPESKRIGPYKLLQKLGEGGCGVVYMAEQEEPVRRRVALKIIKLGMDTKQVIARFEAERQALALMDHPNIAKVLDAGATETGRPYFVMELVRGVKITDFCDQNRADHAASGWSCSSRSATRCSMRIKRESSIATSSRRISWSRMHDGGAGAQGDRLRHRQGDRQRLTDKTLFTAFAPVDRHAGLHESRAGGAERAGHRHAQRHLFAGVLLYELLTGRTPFDTTDLLKLGVEELRRTVREQEPLSPSANSKLSTTTN